MKFVNKLAILVLLIGCIYVQGCYYDVAEDLYPDNDCDTTAISYSTDVIPILTNNGCISCHGNTATLDLDGHADLKIYVDNGSFLGSIKHSVGYRPMPENASKIDPCEIDKLAAWIANGAPNN